MPSLLHIGGGVRPGTDVAGVRSIMAQGWAENWGIGATSGASFGVIQPFGSNAGVTILALAAPTVVRQQGWLSQRLGSGAYPQLDLVANSSDLGADSGSLELVCYSGGFQSVRASNQFDGTPHTWVIGNGESDGYCYRDGAAQALAADTRMSGTYVDAAQELRVGNIADYVGSEYTTTDPIVLLVGWPRLIPRAMAAQMSAAPWSAFAPIERRIWVPSASSAVPNITAVYADSITTTSVVPRVTLDFA